MNRYHDEHGIDPAGVCRKVFPSFVVAGGAACARRSPYSAPVRASARPLRAATQRRATMWVLVARRRQPLEVFAQDVVSSGLRAHVITADLADTDAIPALAEQIRATVGDVDALYYAPT